MCLFSQMFGESLAVWIINEWMKMGSPAQFQLVELGPGKGTLISDILRTISKLEPDCMSGISVHLVEISPDMRDLQRETLSELGCRVLWSEHIAEVPRQFSFFLGLLTIPS